MKIFVRDDEALDDLDRIGSFIAQDKPQAAARVVERIVSSAEILELMPELGRPVRDTRFRELVVSRYPYLLVYEIVADEIHILGVVHQSQDRP